LPERSNAKRINIETSCKLTENESDFAKHSGIFPAENEIQEILLAKSLKIRYNAKDEKQSLDPERA
jgi:hypothetical protein